MTENWSECSVSHCSRPAASSRALYCAAHYAVRWRGEDPEARVFPPMPVKECMVAGCGRPAKTKGVCASHYGQVRFGTLTIDGIEARERCEFPGCDRHQRVKPWCESHHTQFLRLGREGMHPLQVRRPIEQQGSPCLVESCATPSRAMSGLCQRHERVRARFGLPVERVQAIYRKEVCANPACGRGVEDGYRLMLDHDHLHCEKGCAECIRGLLCNGCNTALGMLADDPARARGLADYLDAASAR